MVKWAEDTLVTKCKEILAFLSFINNRVVILFLPSVAVLTSKSLSIKKLI
jgi:hypothetical protein